MEILELRAYARAKEFIEREDTDEEAIAKARIPERLVTLVFENIASGDDG